MNLLLFLVISLIGFAGWIGYSIYEIVKDMANDPPIHR